MSSYSEQFIKYLKHLGLEKENPSINFLAKLQSAQIINFPFENISKIILNHDRNLSGLVDFETHLNNSIKFGLGGTCYACNFYFNQLLIYLGFDADLHGANMISGEDVHIVNIVTFNRKQYLVDAGYGAPFYKPIELTQKKSIINWGNLSYIIAQETDDRFSVSLLRNAEHIHGYTINSEVRSINYFNRIIADSFNKENEMMSILRIIRYFKDNSIELKNFEYTIHKLSSSTKYKINTIDELEYIVNRLFKLPLFPVRRAQKILAKRFN